MWPEAKLQNTAHGDQMCPEEKLNTADIQENPGESLVHYAWNVYQLQRHVKEQQK